MQPLVYIVNPELENLKYSSAWAEPLQYSLVTFDPHALAQGLVQPFLAG